MTYVSKWRPNYQFSLLLKNSLQKCNVFLRLKWQLGSTRGQVVQACPRATKIWYEEPLTEVLCIDGVKSNVEATRIAT